jgi:hypothetical protein
VNPIDKYSYIQEDMRISNSPFLKGLFPKQRKQQGQDDTDKDGGNNGKIKSEVPLSDDDISGKSAEPWDFF